MLDPRTTAQLSGKFRASLGTIGSRPLYRANYIIMKKALLALSIVIVVFTSVTIVLRRSGTLDVPINFSGVVMDENNKPIPGAIVNVSIRSWGYNLIAFFRGGRFSRLTVTTDATGAFSVKNRSGDSLTVESIIKPGYDLVRDRSLIFSPALPESGGLQAQGARFLLTSHEVSSPEGLKTFEFQSRIGCDEGFVNFDLLQNTKSTNSAEGDFHVYFSRNPPILGVNDTKFDWILRLEAPRGGITDPQKALNSFGPLGMMLKAPDNGYKPFYEVAMNQTNKGWRDEKAFTFLFQIWNKLRESCALYRRWLPRENHLYELTWHIEYERLSTPRKQIKFTPLTPRPRDVVPGASG